jgi:hypothetical protein
MPKSTWTERILPSLGYRKSAIVEIPLEGQTPIPQVMRKAIGLWEEARADLHSDQFRAAVQKCRQAKEALTSRKASWATTQISPLVGDIKATMVDDVLRAFGNLFEAASHPIDKSLPTNVEVTRDDALFAVHTLTLVMNYLTKQYRQQG